MGEYKKTARLQVVLGPEMLIRIDDYRHQRRFAGDVSARANSKSDAIRTLVRLALEKTLPPGHVEIIDRMHRERAGRTEEEYKLLLDKYHDSLERTHLALEQREINAIDRYKDYANQFGENLESRADAIRRLLEFSLGGKPPNNHLDILDSIDIAFEPRIQERALQIWKEEGAPQNESEARRNERWFNAKKQILAKDEKAGKSPEPALSRAPTEFDPS